MTSADASARGTVLHTLVVDDEKLARSGLRAMLAADPELRVEECASGRDAVRIIRERGGTSPVDLVFLDVRMPAMDGFNVIEAIGVDCMPVVVFTTAYSDYAIQAFEVCALDYLLKPVGEARLARAVARAKESIRLRRDGGMAQRLATLLARREATTSPVSDSADSEEAARPLRRILLRSGAKNYYVDVDDIDWIEADAYYVRLWTGTRSHLLRQTLNQLETLVDPRQFVRVHRSAIVHVAKVRAFERVRLGKYCVRLLDGRQVPLSRDRRRTLRAALRAHARNARSD